MMPLRALLAALLSPFAATACLADTLTYENERFGTTVTFPLETFDLIAPPPANGDGRRFLSGDGAELAAYGQFNSLDQTPETLVEWKTGIIEEDGGTVTYSTSGEAWAVLSGRDGETTFYERHEFSADGNVIHSMEMRYPTAASAHYHNLVEKVAETLEGP